MSDKMFATCSREMQTLMATHCPVKLVKGGGTPFVRDAFSAECSAKLPKYWTKEEDAFAQDWTGQTLWVHPPYSMAAQVLQKIKDTPNFTGCVFLPEWYSQDWFYSFCDHSTTLKEFPSEDGMFLLHGVQIQPKPKWNCVAFYFIGYDSSHISVNFVGRNTFLVDDLPPLVSDSDSDDDAIPDLASDFDSDSDDDDIDNTSEEFYTNENKVTIGTANAVTVTPLFVRTISISCGGIRKKLRALFDGGANATIISPRVLPKQWETFMQDGEYSFSMANDTSSNSKGTLTLAVDLRDNQLMEYEYDFFVSELSSRYDVLLGRDFLQMIKATDDFENNEVKIKMEHGSEVILQPDWKRRDANSVTPSVKFLGQDVEVGTLPNERHEEFRQLLQEFKDVFSVPGDVTKLPAKSEFEHKIVLKDPNKVHYAPPFPMPRPHLDWLRKIYDERISNDCAELAENCPYASRAFVIPKKAPGQFREVIDYRALNENTVKDKFPLPRIEALFDETQLSPIKSICDMQDGYYNYRMEEKSARLAAVMTPFGLIINHIMEQGLCNAPPFFQRANTSRMSDLIFERKELLLYLDDLMSHTKDIDSHFAALRRLFQRCQDNSLKLKLAKCHFFQVEVPWLGHVLEDGKVRPDPKLVAAITEYPIPRSLKALRGFLGLAGYYRRFIPRFATHATPLTNLLLKNAPTVEAGWGESQKSAFLAIKNLLSSDTVLRLYDPTLETEMHCDASTEGIGGVLLQLHDDGWHPVGYYSARMNEAQRRYTTTEQEMLAIIVGLQKWKIYLIGRHFVIRTDHKAGTFIKSKSAAKLSMRELRWLDTLADYDFEIAYLQGKMNIVPDSLSRNEINAWHIANLFRIDDLDTTDYRYAPCEPFGYVFNFVQEPHSDFEDSVYTVSPRDCITDSLPRMKEDATYLKLIQDPPNNCQVIDGYLYYQDERNARAMFIPDIPELRNLIVKTCHDHPYAGHMGRDRTIALIRRYFYWPGMTQYIADYIKQCPICQLCNPGNKKPAAPLVPIPPAGFPFREVTMDYLSVPLTDSGFDYLLVIVCRFTKYAIFIKTQKTINGEGAGRLFLTFVIRYFGVPRKIISDRGSVIVHGFWPQFMKAIGIHSAYTTAYHPQANGQTERMNRSLLSVLRKYCSDHPHDWDLYIDTVNFACNNSIEFSTGYSAFFSILGYHPETPLFLDSTVPLTTLDEHVSALIKTHRTIYDDISAALHRAAQRMKFHADKYRREQNFTVGDMVKLRTGLLHTTDKDKLDPFWSGPYKVLQVDADNNTVKLELPDTTTHPVFNFDKIEPFRVGDSSRFPLSAPTPTSALADDSTRYLFDIVYFRDFSTKHVRYYVHWIGYETTPSHSKGWAYETPDTLQMFIEAEQGYGIFPEKGINASTSARVENHKRTAYGHVFPILVSTRSVSTRTVRNRSKTTTAKLPHMSSSLVGRIVEDLRDISLEHAIFMAGLITSYDSTSTLFTVQWTDGSTSAWTLAVAFTKLLSPDPVRVID